MAPFRTLLVAATLALAPAAAHAQFDHAHAAWDALLRKHVKVIDGGKSTQVRYADFARDRPALKAYLAEVSKVTPAQFDAWPKAERMAFLVNAYNAFTVELILTRYPDLKSIKDLGNFVFTPWKKKFFTLFGEEWHLDRIEHETLRKPGLYDEPRVHYAVNCASIGCPALREEAFVAARLEAQLEEQARRFLSDRSRNRFNPATGRLEVSEIFKWFKEDWTSGYRGFGGGGAPVTSREQYFARYADLLADRPGDRRLVAEGKAPIDHAAYDWSLNDAR